MDLVVHLLRVCDRLHDLNEVREFKLTLFVCIPFVDEFLYRVVGQVNTEAAKQVFEFAGRNGAITVFIEELESLPVLL